ncbi:MAG: hypothetical protein WBW92_00445, partial [Rhodanobacteraceae bacterium]
GDSGLVQSMRRDGDRRIYNTLTYMLYLMNIANPAHSWKTRLLRLIDTHDIDVSDMGFPRNWRALPLWR